MTYKIKKSIVLGIVFFILLLSFGVFFLQKPFLDVYFGPAGGFAKMNYSRNFGLFCFKKKATMSEAVHRIFTGLPNKSKIYIAMYSISDREATKDIINSAVMKNCSVRLLFDGAEWSEKGRSNFIKSLKTEISNTHKRDIDFAIRYTPHSVFKEYGRSSVLSNGEVIYGSMHEKFALFFKNNERIASVGFFGSANLSWSSSIKYCENRFVFKSIPYISRAYEGRFVHLWNKYGVPLYGNGDNLKFSPEPDITKDTNIKILFNAEGYSLNSFIKETIRKAKKSIDIMLFSFTDRDIADTILQKARTSSDIKVRILLDQSQLIETEDKIALQGPYIEDIASKERLTNISVRYKWRINAYDWLDDKAGLNHFRVLLLHHKTMIVDRYILLTGSYNWSASAEKRNLEDIMFIRAHNRFTMRPVKRFLAEMDTLWNNVKSDRHEYQTRKYSFKVITGDDGRKLRARMLAILSEPIGRGVRFAVERNLGLYITNIHSLFTSDTNIINFIGQKEQAEISSIKYSIDSFIELNALYTNNGRVFLSD